MNCCDEYGNCRQGRDCPARVAKVGKRTPKAIKGAAKPQPLDMRRNLRHLAKWMLITIAVIFGTVALGVIVGAVK